MVQRLAVDFPLHVFSQTTPQDWREIDGHYTISIEPLGSKDVVRLPKHRTWMVVARSNPTNLRDRSLYFANVYSQSLDKQNKLCLTPRLFPRDAHL